MNSLNILFVLFIVVGLANAACQRDSYTSLPNAPVFPTATLAAADAPKPSTYNPLIQNHWSEVAKIGNYRPAKITPSATPAQTNCPHLAAGLKDWHDASIWPNGALPTNGATFSLPANTAVLISSCSFDPTWVFGVITVPGTSKLILGDANIKLQSTGINVLPGGSFLAGSATCRLRNKIEITFHGQRPASTPGGTNEPWRKGIAVTNGTLDIHGAQYFPTWTRLAMTATPGSSWIFIQDIVNWQPGQTILITTTEVKDARDWHRNEEAQIAEVRLAPSLGPNVCAVRLVAPIAYTHFGGREYQAEVALLSRNILIQGDAVNSEPTDTNAICNRTQDASTWPCEDSFLTGFGAHIIVQGALSSGRFSGVEMFRAGQTNVLGRYPIHIHLLGNITESNYARAFVQDSSVHRSYFRCYAIHGTNGVLFTQNTAYDAIGHCYFLEDGVEEDNIISYNQAAHIHPLGPIVNPSNNINNDGFGGQQLSWYSESSKLLLPSDMGAGCFYITNTYNDFFGNAASGGWAGFTIPSLRLPVKNHAHIKTFVPANRPFRTPFRGNSAHSSGYWWRSAGSIYVGGELQQNDLGQLNYTLGRSRSRGTCANLTAGAPGGLTYCPLPLWLTFEDNKVFLSNRGLQNWGDRSEIIRFELHDVGLAMNVFGRVWIDQMLMECRQLSHKPIFFNGCPGAPNEFGTNLGHRCNQRDTVFWTNFGGFQWYDVGQRHILTNTTFRNCANTWDRCLSGGRRGNCSNIAVFTSLTHSDQFVPEIMQTTQQIIYQNVSDLWRFTTKTTDRTGITVSGRLQSWIDVDGTAAQLPGRSMIGSGWAGEWWKVNKDCIYQSEAWKCKLAGNDGISSFKFRYDVNEEAQIGSTICMNGGGANPCPVIGQLAHFGMKNESAGLLLAANTKVTGPIIGASGGWFVRFTKGTPKELNVNSLQLVETTPLILALPYPANTNFEIYYAASGGCNPSGTTCRHNYTAVNSVAKVLSSFGDAYFWNSQTKTLYLRIVQTPSNWGRKGMDPLVWNTSYVVTDTFSRDGLSLVNSASSSIWIKASCAGFYCDPQPDVPVPASITLPTPPTPSPGPTQPPTQAPVNTGPPETSSSNDDSREDPSDSDSDSDSQNPNPSPNPSSSPATTASPAATTGNGPSQNSSSVKTAVSALFIVASLVVMFM